MALWPAAYEVISVSSHEQLLLVYIFFNLPLVFYWQSATAESEIEHYLRCKYIDNQTALAVIVTLPANNKVSICGHF